MKNVYSEMMNTNCQQHPTHPQTAYNTGMMPHACTCATPQTQYPIFPPQSSGSTISSMPGNMMMPGMGQSMPNQTNGMLPMEESYIENILRMNHGKIGTFYFTFENNNEWNAKVIKGRVEAAGRDHIILSDPETGERYLMLMVSFDYATFDERLNYEYPPGITPPRPVPPR